jgi:large subunit ribosomal protein L10
MPNVEKVEKVAALKERIQGSNALLLAEYRGLSVHDATELRRALSDSARFSVVKNTLMQRAAGAAGIEELESLLSGPTAVAFVEGDVVSAAKKVVDAAKRFPSLVLKGAYMEGKVLDAKAAQALATLDSREVMLSKVAGMLKSEMSRAASMLQALQGRFLGLLEAYREKVPGAEAPEAVSEPEPAPELAPEHPVAEVPSGEPAGEALVEEPSTMEDVETPEDASSATNEEE